MEYTIEQQSVLQAEGKIIVSASAGSGKTFVMIERIIQAVLSGADLSRMLAVTFTKKAAAQMREKIQKALLVTINSTSDEQIRERLRKQLNDLPMAEISTIHAFCSKLLRSYFYFSGVNSAFEIISGDDAEGQSLQSEAIEAVFAQAYEENDPLFLDLLSVYFRSKTDQKFKDMLLSVYSSLRSRADYREVLRQTREKKEIWGEVCNDLFEYCKRENEHLLRIAEDLLSDLQQLGRGKKTQEQCAQICEYLREITVKNSYFEFCAMEKPQLTARDRISAKDPQLNVLAERCASLRKKFFDFLKSHLGTDEEAEKERFERAQTTASGIAELLLRFDDEYTRLKTEHSKLDYNDLEHYTLKLLENQTVIEELKNKFDYIFVDEYQDVNPVQESILSKIVGENVFLVGDVKQSIYAFRGGKSRYFTEKCITFDRDEKSHFLELTSNFRSGRAILRCVNKVFCNAMTKETSDVYYSLSPMKGGDGYGAYDGRVVLHTLQEEEKQAKEWGVYSVLEEYLAAKQRRVDNPLANEVLNIIRNDYGSPYFNLDEKRECPVTYGDIAILSRKLDDSVNDVITALSENGIPVSSTSKVNLCNFSEIAQLIDILSLIDNKEQDIPLCSALLSEMGRLTNDDLVTIKLRYQSNRNPFRYCVREYADSFEDAVALKLRRFFDLLGKYSALSVTLGAGELCERLIAESGQETKWLSMENGQRRVSRVRTFILQMADKNVHEFLQYLKDLDYNLPVTENQGENAVKVMTIHASKGLEYPIVLLIGLDRKFHGADSDELLLSEKYGIATNSYQLDRRLKYSTLLRRLIGMEQREEELKGELNLLYVAMTRAKYALHLIMKEQKEEEQDPFYARCYSDLLPPAVLDECELSFGYSEVAAFEKRKIILSAPDEELKRAIEKSFNFQYAHTSDENLPVKTSASGLMQSADTEEYYKTVDVLSYSKENPQTEKNKIGTAYHAFLQYADFSKDGEEELERLRAAGVLSEDTLALLSPKKCKEILSMPVFKALAEVQLYREQAFMVYLPAKEMIEGSVSDRNVLFQGFIDLLVIGKQGVQIIDYKYSSLGTEEIKKHYAVQIKLYKKAAAKIMKIKEETISARIVNIQTSEVTDMD